MSSSATPQNEVLSSLFNRMRKARSDEERSDVATALTDYLVDISSDTNIEERAKSLWPEITKQVFSLLPNEGGKDEKLGFVAAISALVLSNQTNSAVLIRFYGYLKRTDLLYSNDESIRDKTCTALGRIAARSSTGPEISTLIKADADHYIQHLTPASLSTSASTTAEGNRQITTYLPVAVQMLHIFALNARGNIAGLVPQIIPKIWLALRDSRLHVRERTYTLLKSLLVIVRDMSQSVKNKVYKSVYEEAVRGEGGGVEKRTEWIHASLLAYGALFEYGEMWMTPYYTTTCESILRYRDSKDLIIRKMVISTIPLMAVYDPVLFSYEFLGRSMQHLLAVLGGKGGSAGGEGVKGMAFVAVGHVCVRVGGGEAKRFLDGVVREVKSGLESLVASHQQTKGKKSVPSALPPSAASNPIPQNHASRETDLESSLFITLSLLSQAFGPLMTKYMNASLLTLMFSLPLSEPLRLALVDVGTYCKPLEGGIQERLLEMLSRTLSGKEYVPLGKPTSNVIISKKQLPIQPAQSKETLSLALRTLSSFEFGGHILNEFVRDCALPYLEHDSPEVRGAAVVTCCRLFAADPIVYQTSTHSVEIMSEVLDGLLTVGIADPDPKIRQTVLEELTDKFDRHLAQSSNVRRLFLGLHDTVFHNRELVVIIIGRLSTMNPAYVVSSLRKALFQMITTLRDATSSRQKEEAAKLLCLIVAACPKRVVDYTKPLVKVLLETAYLKESTTVVVASCIECLGEVARVAGESITDSVDAIMRLIVETLQDPAASIKRDAALKTLGQVASNTGTAVDAYVQYPELMGLLLRIVKLESSHPVRREAIRVLGILGALDPYRHKLLHHGADDPAADHSRSGMSDITLLMHAPGGQTSDEYYQMVAVNSLVGVILDPTLSPLLHEKAISGVMHIFKAQGLKCVSFLPQVIPAFLSVIRLSSPAFQTVFLNQLAILVGIVKQHIRNFIEPILSLILEFWNHPTLQIYSIALVEMTARSLDGEFKAFVPRLIQDLLRTFEGEVSEQKRQAVLLRVLKSLDVLGANLEEYIHLIIPVVLRLLDHPGVSIDVQEMAIISIGQLSRKVNLSDQAAQIIHPIEKVLSGSSSTGTGGQRLVKASMDTLSALIIQLGSDFAVFIPILRKVISSNNIYNAQYEQLVAKVLSGERLPQDFSAIESMAPFVGDKTEVAAANLSVNQARLKMTWDTSQCQSHDDWRSWLTKLGIELLNESPSVALRACVDLAIAYPLINKELFNVAFISCWASFYDTYQDDAVEAIHYALTFPGNAPEVIHALLNLCEFAEHDDKTLPIEINELASLAFKYHAYAKGLHYRELEFFADPTQDIISSLIAVNGKLGQEDAAWGTLTYARDDLEHNQANGELFEYEGWYVELGRWQEALESYRQKEETAAELGEVLPDNTMNMMKCLHALGDWDRLSELVQNKWADASAADHRSMAPLAAAAAWALKQWDLMDDYVAVMRRDTPDYFFYRAVLSIHSNQFPKALRHIIKARDSVDPELFSMVGDSYGRAYNVIVRVQMLSELEEIITYKQQADQPERQAAMRKTWMKRLTNCQRDVEIWQRILQVRSLVLTPAEDKDMWIKFANLCRKSDRMSLAEKTLNSLLGQQDAGSEGQAALQAPPHVVYAYFKFTWAQNDPKMKADSLKWLETFTNKLTTDLGMDPNYDGGVVVPPEAGYSEFTKLLARCHVKQGEWKVVLTPNWTTSNPLEILTLYKRATQLDPDWYKAWHTWALANFQVISQLESVNDQRAHITPADISTYIVPSVEAFFRSIALSKGNSLQDTLRLLTLWFKYGAHQAVNMVIVRGTASVSIDVWLEVIPQIIARIQAPNALIRTAIEQLLAGIGRAHPQALIYPLLVASKSSVLMRKEVALGLMNRMRETSSTLVAQASLVSHELIRVAILWHELWTEGLEEASRCYFADHNPGAMFAVLEPLHDMMDRGPETLREQSFVQNFAHDLQVARDYCRRYREYGDTNDLSQAWDNYYMVFKKLTKALQTLPALELQYVSPKLLKARNLELAVPGTYQSGKPVVKIMGFVPTFSVITSKQRPRRLQMQGSDGKDYQFLLKGHEDLRQDERVMQLFGLVNTLLSLDPESFKRHLHIQPFSVTPLSPNSGLIGWVPDTDTMHVLIRDYRDSRKILLNIEHRLILQMAPDYDYLTLMQKVEVFEYALENTTGQDLYRVLWLKSRNSESWLDRRTTYIRSLAANSMVGYILGLGDRHPSNLLLDRVSGKVVHIDFGDCFEITMNREKFPEKIPFRLTRMLTNAMEVCGIHGSYTKSCEIVMSVLRDNRDSLMAVLEAFVYDPLFSWRLAQQPTADITATNEDSQDRAAFGGNRRNRADETEMLNNPEVQNPKALSAIKRIEDKLTGRDFKAAQVLVVEDQVKRLIREAMSMENLCQCFIGWCAFW